MATLAICMPDKPQTARSSGRDDEYAHRLERIAAERDVTAFSELFDHFAPRIKSFMMRKGASDQLAEDLVQETMIAVWTKAGLYSAERGSAATWIFTIARNLRIDRIRRESSAHLTDLDGFDKADDAPLADDLLSRGQESGLVARALERIPSEQREILILSYVEDVPQSEIAEKLNLPLGTVKSRMRLAYRRLRKMLETKT